MKEKLMFLKEGLKNWNMEVFRWIDLSIDEEVDMLNEVEADMCNARRKL